ncbi:WD-repeat protein [Anabaenopsis circularis NIES-21]|uniref:WD-repeat protein n=1 Tax=Anabaenopsis circularis NIES-21 TaxID=1085406 RepID=A0A1Z4GIL0_9CYAN|nr:WD-repeat protein [Anabaenopsis circularis NIES-21]
MDWECVLTLTEYFTIYCIAISSNSEILASAGHGKISIWHLQSRQRLHSLIAHDDEIHHLSLTADGRILVSASASEPTAIGLVKVWNTLTGEELGSWTEKTGSSIAIALHPEGKILAVGTDFYYEKPAINLWNLETLISLGTLAKFRDDINSLAYSPDGENIAVAVGCDIQICNMTGQILFKLTAHMDVIECVVFSPDGKKLVSSSGIEQTIRLWNFQTGKQDYCISTTDYGCYPSSIAFSPDGKTLASNSYEHNIQLWNVKTGELICNLGQSEQITSVQFAQKGMLISSSDRTIQIWRKT